MLVIFVNFMDGLELLLWDGVLDQFARWNLFDILKTVFLNCMELTYLSSFMLVFTLIIAMFGCNAIVFQRIYIYYGIELCPKDSVAHKPI